VEHAREKYEVSERHACRLLGQWRRTQRYAAIRRIDEEALSEAIIQLASEYGRYGYRRITALLQDAGWPVGKDRVQRIWAAGRVESAAETAAAREVVAERWIVHSAAAGAGESCVELRFRQRKNPRWKNRPDADADR
jgi:hypothetical protein